MSDLSPLFDYINSRYQTYSPVPLHAPSFNDQEIAQVNQVIKSTLVSTVGDETTRFENAIANYCHSEHAFATINGTAALFLGLKVAGVEPGTEVLTQSLTFVATANSVRHLNAEPVFIDIDRDTLGLSPDALRTFLQDHTEQSGKELINKISGRRIAACMPMHTLGNPCRIDEIIEICEEYHLPVIEDATEALGSTFKNRALGTWGKAGTFSFNGNKIITTGGGGMLICKDKAFAEKVRHLGTTARIPHTYEITHDEVGYNYRLPSLNAALGMVQLGRLTSYLEQKKQINLDYHRIATEAGRSTLQAIDGASSNHWLSALITHDRKERDQVIRQAITNNIMLRPLWQPMHTLKMYKDCQHTGMSNTEWAYDHIVCLPSGPQIIE